MIQRRNPNKFPYRNARFEHEHLIVVEYLLHNLIHNLFNKFNNFFKIHNISLYIYYIQNNINVQ